MARVAYPRGDRQRSRSRPALGRWRASDHDAADAQPVHAQRRAAVGSPRLPPARGRAACRAGGTGQGALLWTLPRYRYALVFPPCTRPWNDTCLTPPTSRSSAAARPAPRSPIRLARTGIDTFLIERQPRARVARLRRVLVAADTRSTGRSRTLEHEVADACAAHLGAAARDTGRRCVSHRVRARTCQWLRPRALDAALLDRARAGGRRRAHGERGALDRTARKARRLRDARCVADRRRERRRAAHDQGALRRRRRRTRLDRGQGRRARRPKPAAEVRPDVSAQDPSGRSRRPSHGRAVRVRSRLVRRHRARAGWSGQHRHRPAR